MKRLFFFMAIVVFPLMFLCANPNDLGVDSETHIIENGGVDITAKLANNLTRSPSCSLYFDLIPLIGDTIKNATVGTSFSNLFSQLPVGLTKYIIKGRDFKNKTINLDGGVFNILSGEIIPLNIESKPLFSILSGEFPEMDKKLKVSRYELIVDGQVVTFHLVLTRSGPVLVYDYFKALDKNLIFPFNNLSDSALHIVRFKVFSTFWGSDTLVYDGAGPVWAKSNKKVDTKMFLTWVGPQNPLFGNADIDVSIITADTTTIQGELVNPANLYVQMMPGDDKYVVAGNSDVYTAELKTWVENGMVKINSLEFEINANKSGVPVLARKSIKMIDLIHNGTSYESRLIFDNKVVFNDIDIEVSDTTHFYLRPYFHEIGVEATKTGEPDVRVSFIANKIVAKDLLNGQVMKNAIKDTSTFMGFNNIYWDNNGDSLFNKDDIICQTTKSHETQVLYTKIGCVESVGNAEGINLSTYLAAPVWTNAFILKVSVSSSINTLPNGEPVEIDMKYLVPTIEKSVGTGISEVSVKRLGAGASNEKSIVPFVDGERPVIDMHQLPTSDTKINSGEIGYFLIELNIASLNVGDDNDWVRVSFRNLNKSFPEASIGWSDGDSMTKFPLRLIFDEFYGQEIMD